MPDTDPRPVARLVRYSGHVQGVGFRVTAVTIARSFRVTGWVRNLSDGRVQLLVEGPATEVSQFLDSIADHWADQIDATEIETREPTGSHRRFDVVR